jgi:hypothetical protein
MAKVIRVHIEPMISSSYNLNNAKVQYPRGLNDLGWILVPQVVVVNFGVRVRDQKLPSSRTLNYTRRRLEGM